MDDKRDVEFEAETDPDMRRGDTHDAKQKIEKLKEELTRMKKERQENLDGWQRAKADYVNALRRFEEEKKQERARGITKAVEALLPAFDALERAKEHGDVPEGFEAIVRQLEAAFASLGLTAVGEVGEAFDPQIHEALGQDAVQDKAQDNTVTAVLEKGWKQGDPSNPSGQGQVIRPAKVRVGHLG